MADFRKKIIVGLLACMSAVSLYSNPLDPTKREKISAYDYYNLIIDFFQNEQWDKVIWQSEALMQDFPDAPLAKEVYYYLGAAHYQIDDFETANRAFSLYLKEEMTPKFFNETIEYKFKIACHFQEGMKRRLFHMKGLPKWVHGYDEAIEIFDEVIATLPRDEMAAESLYRKGVLLLEIREYKESIEAFQILIRRFPKNSLAPECYLGIANVYLAQTEREFSDGDKLDLAEINLRKFRFHFPGEPRLEEAERKLIEMKNLMADDLLEIGQFYQRTKRKKAAAIYYQVILKKYPQTKAAHISKRELQKMGFSETVSEMSKGSDALIVESGEISS